MGLAVLPLALGTFAAANLAALRNVRAGAEELLDTLPEDARVRTGAQLLAVLAAVPLALALLAGAYLLFGAGDGLVIGRTARAGCRRWSSSPKGRCSSSRWARSACCWAASCPLPRSRSCWSSRSCSRRSRSPRGRRTRSGAGPCRWRTTWSSSPTPG